MATILGLGERQKTFVEQQKKVSVSSSVYHLARKPSSFALNTYWPILLLYCSFSDVPLAVAVVVP